MPGREEHSDPIRIGRSRSRVAAGNKGRHRPRLTRLQGVEGGAVRALEERVDRGPDLGGEGPVRFPVATYGLLGGEPDDTLREEPVGAPGEERKGAVGQAPYRRDRRRGRHRREWRQLERGNVYHLLEGLEERQLLHHVRWPRR